MTDGEELFSTHMPTSKCSNCSYLKISLCNSFPVLLEYITYFVTGNKDVRFVEVFNVAEVCTSALIC